VGEINGKHSKISGPPPVQFIYYSVNINKLAALYNIADIALVLPLIDGMNLVAKEYICVQPDKYDPNGIVRPGTLLLSEFTGASSELFNAQIINPYNYPEVAETIQRALTTPYEERVQANLPMRSRTRSQDAEWWAFNFLKDLQNEVAIHDLCLPCSVNSLVKPFLITAPGRKALFLDYDGTLTPIVSSPQAAIPSKRLLQLLENLSNRKDLDVVVVSGRPREFLDLHLGRFANLTLVSEHGFQIRKAGTGNWELSKKSVVIDWRDKILPYLELYVTCTPGSFIEEKKSAIVWHYRQSDPELAMKRAVDLVGQLSEFITNLPVEIHHGKKIVEVSSIEINKGQIVKDFLQNNEYTAAFCAGDDSTDETMFRIQNKLLTKIKVGDGDTETPIHDGH
jgi:trehalose 6-phosphate synthase/phosphatase